MTKHKEEKGHFGLGQEKNGQAKHGSSKHGLNNHGEAKKEEKSAGNFGKTTHEEAGSEKRDESKKY